jgi:hypothetical protein
VREEETSTGCRGRSLSATTTLPSPFHQRRAGKSHAQGHFPRKIQLRLALRCATKIGGRIHMSIRLMLTALVILGMAQVALALDTRSAQKGETCNGFKKSCIDACPSSGGGALRRKCVDECNLSVTNCNTTGTWSSGNLRVTGLPTTK